MNGGLTTNQEIIMESQSTADLINNHRNSINTYLQKITHNLEQRTMEDRVDIAHELIEIDDKLYRLYDELLVRSMPPRPGD